MNTPFSTNNALKNVLVVFKHSRYTYAEEHAEGSQVIFDHHNPLTKQLLLAHDKNQACIDHVVATLKKLNIAHSAICRSELNPKQAKNCFIISVGGDGTLLDVSHQCSDSIVLGVNSDPDSSRGALCAAQANNFEKIFKEIYQGKLQPTKLARLAITVGHKDIGINALNDVLFCHKNPAAMSRFSVSLKGLTENSHASGIWIATPAGSTGGIFSAGASPLPLLAHHAIFLQREPSWSQASAPSLLCGAIQPGEKIVITANMSDAAIFVDGPHKMFDVPLGHSVEIALSDQSLWLFDGEKLEEGRKKLIAQRKGIQQQLKGRMSC